MLINVLVSCFLFVIILSCSLTEKKIEVPKMSVAGMLSETFIPTKSQKAV